MQLTTAVRQRIAWLADNTAKRMRTSLACFLVIVAAGLLPATAQQTSEDDSAAADPTRLVIRFLTSDDYPPFNSRDEEGVLTGLNVDLARAICLELSVTCDIQVRGWSTLLPAVKRGEADAVIAAHRVTLAAVSEVAFTDRYFLTPARFAVRRGGEAPRATPDGMDGLRAGVVANSAHEAYLTNFFRNTRVTRYDTPELAQEALMQGKVDTVFDDGIGLGFWVNGSLSRNCCELVPGAFFEPAYFGDGIAIAVRRDDRALLQQLNTALRRVRKNGRFDELVERYFPIRIY